MSAEHAMAEEHRDPVGARIGMWLFLFTELLLFGGLFLLYAVYRAEFTEDFHYAAGTLDSTIGTINTIILLTSSLTMALAITAVSRGRRALAAMLMSVTIASGLVFMVNKYFEWSHKFALDLIPGSKALLRHTPGENLFYGMYYAMTGLHGVHVVIGLVVLAVMLYQVLRRPRRTLTLGPSQAATLEHAGDDDAPPVGAQVTVYYDEHDEVTETLTTRMENAGLYWHLVDVIWIFLFPLFYLIS